MSDDLSGDMLAPSWPNLVIGPRGLQCETNLKEIMGWESSDVVRFVLGSGFKVRQGYPKLKVLITRLFLVLQVCNVKPSYWKSWTGNLLMWSDLTLDPSFKIKREKPNLKVLIPRLLLVLEVCNVKLTYRKSWAGNILMQSDLTLGPGSRSDKDSQS